MRRKLGLFTEEEGDVVLIRELLAVMHRSQADFTLTFRRLCQAAESEAVASVVADSEAIDSEAAAGEAATVAVREAAPDRDWLCTWRARLAREPRPAGERAASMRLANPCYIPRNHRIEAVLRAAVERRDYAPFEELSRVLAAPYQERSEYFAYTRPPLPEERVTQTFCGT
jgi:uncharacterized protein YdiU (UPF0061 family)